MLSVLLVGLPSCKDKSDLTPPEGVKKVDLGLSVKWANMNVGATNGQSPESWYGNYYAWGETTPKATYAWRDAYKWCTAEGMLTKYCNNSIYGTVDNKTVLDASDDAVRVNWGGNWRMPTKAELDELTSSCTWSWVANYNGISGLNGCVVTGPNGQSIFLPAAGYAWGTSTVLETGSCCYYWSASLCDDDVEDAFAICAHSRRAGRARSSRYYGFLVRPVCP